MCFYWNTLGKSISLINIQSPSRSTTAITAMAVILKDGPPARVLSFMNIIFDFLQHPVQIFNNYLS